jgi:hypothetical protein
VSKRGMMVVFAAKTFAIVITVLCAKINTSAEIGVTREE